MNALQIPHDEMAGNIAALVERYFTNPERMRILRNGEILFNEGSPNERVYYIIEGSLNGHVSQSVETEDTWFHAEKGDVVGVKSFFSDHIHCLSTVVAVGVTKVAWLSLADVVMWHEEHEVPIRSPEKELLPLFVHALNRRQKRICELMECERTSQARAAELEKDSQLGQFSAGVAHELNNALAVIERGTEWLKSALDAQMRASEDIDYAVFAHGNQNGRNVSAADVRTHTRSFQRNMDLSPRHAKMLSQMGLPSHVHKSVVASGEIPKFSALWELGATVHDVATAAEQAACVVESMKNLGAASYIDTQSVSVQGSIQAALIILRTVTRGVEVQMSFPDMVPYVRGNKGELVQVWMNIIKNACEALRSAGTKSPQIVITCVADAELLCVRIHDNGPGIPAALRMRVFDPNFTTKKSGMEFGLGIGLNIVRKIVISYGGAIEVLSKDASSTVDGTCFSISLPHAVSPEQG